jgi:histidinol-phosphatase (PHP family)
VPRRPASPSVEHPYWLAPDAEEGNEGDEPGEAVGVAEDGSRPANAAEAHDLPLDAHLHTDQSPDSDVPIDVYAAEALARGIPEIAITDHVDFDPRDPAYRYTSYGARERTVRDAAERWAERGVTIRFGLELTYHAWWEDQAREHLRRHRYDYVIGSVHEWPDSPYLRERVAGWVEGRSIEEIVRPYLDQVVAAARSGLFDTIGHLDVVKRYLNPFVTPEQLADRLELYDGALAAIVEAGAALEVNSSGLRHTVREPYPRPETVARFRELGGERVVAGSDAHRKDWFAYRLEAAYDAIAAAGFEELAFRRGAAHVRIPVPRRRAA